MPFVFSHPALVTTKLGTACYSSRMRSILLVLCILTTLAAACPAQQTKSQEPTYPIGNGVTPPRAISTPSPNFADDAKRGKFNGKVVVAGYIGTDGRFHDAKVFQSIGDSQIDAKCVNAVKTWKFHPCTKDGKPVNCELHVDIAVHLD